MVSRFKYYYIKNGYSSPQTTPQADLSVQPTPVCNSDWLLVKYQDQDQLFLQLRTHYKISCNYSTLLQPLKKACHPRMFLSGIHEVKNWIPD
jgi:hypothetical protein